jgi:hypothetical protein
MGVSHNYRDVANVVVHVKPVWHNADNQLDVDGDGNVKPLDVLHLINASNLVGRGSIDDLETHERVQEALLGGRLRPDVNNDGEFTALDILHLVNYFNSQSVALAPGGEAPFKAATLKSIKLDQDESTLSLVPDRIQVQPTMRKAISVAGLRGTSGAAENVAFSASLDLALAALLDEDFPLSLETGDET